MGRLTERYKQQVNPGLDPDNYTFYSRTGDPEDMVPIRTVRQNPGMEIARPYVDNMMSDARKRIPDRISIEGALQPAGNGGTAAAYPQIDTGDAIGSLAGLLGPTPAEREARDRRLQENKARMAAWTGMFDGLRHMSNLYYTSRGAAPQRYSNPYGEVERSYQDARQLAIDSDNYRRQYAIQLWNLRRQADDDARRMKLADAQAQYYGTRDEMARLKAENDRLKNEAAIRNYDARTRNTDAKTTTEDALREDKAREIESRINRNKQAGAAAMIRANKTGSGRGGGGKSGGYDPYDELATNLEQHPEVVGPILQEQGSGVYDKENNKFTFTKNPTKGMATTANKRTRQQVKNKTNRTNGANGVNGGKRKINW